MTMNSKARKVALVTGASSGIGQATAELLAKAGYKAYGTSRRGGDASGRSFEMLSLDVISDESVDAAVQMLMQAESRIDLLVNNAGFGVAPAGAEESSIEQGKAATAVHPKIHYAPGLASRMRMLRRFAPASVLDAGVRKDLRLEA